MKQNDARLDVQLRWTLFGLTAGLALTGVLSFLGWFVPYFTEGILPAWFVDPIRDSHLGGSPVLHVAHWVLGTLLLIGTITYSVLWRQGRVHPVFLDRGVETSTSAFWHWVAGWFAIHRDARLRFRDALMMPRLEFAVSLVVASATFILRWIPGPIGEAMLSLHRINGIYLTFLGVYVLVALVLKRRGESPHPTYIRDGRIRHDGAPGSD